MTFSRFPFLFAGCTLVLGACGGALLAKATRPMQSKINVSTSSPSLQFSQTEATPLSTQTPITQTLSTQGFQLVALQNRAPARKSRFIRVGLSTKGGNIALLSRGAMTITDALQPSRRLAVKANEAVVFSYAASTQVQAGNVIYGGPISIRTSGGEYAAWQMPRIYANAETRVASDNGNPRFARAYRGSFEIAPQTFTFDPEAHKSKLRVVNVVELEDYLKGVVPWEMDTDAPMEALKAQAICARSETLANIATRRFAPDGYDICDYDRCQGYPGTENEHPRTSAAVAQTSGLAMYHGGRIVNAVYGTNNGGIVAASEDVWKGAPEPYLKSVRDVDAKKHALTARFLNRKMTEADWMEYCSRIWPSYAQPSESEIAALAARRRKSARTAALFQAGDLPNFYRWSRAVHPQALAEALAPRFTANAQEPMVVATAIRVLERAPSGHIKKLRIDGKTASGQPVGVQLSGDSEIRSMLSRRLGSTSALPSSTFAIVARTDASGTVRDFLLRGAGWGHGVGMCQSGARRRALSGQNARTILNFYFRGVQIRPIS